MRTAGHSFVPVMAHCRASTPASHDWELAINNVLPSIELRFSSLVIKKNYLLIFLLKASWTLEGCTGQMMISVSSALCRRFLFLLLIADRSYRLWIQNDHSSPPCTVAAEFEYKLRDIHSEIFETNTRTHIGLGKVQRLRTELSSYTTKHSQGFVIKSRWPRVTRSHWWGLPLRDRRRQTRGQRS